MTKGDLDLLATLNREPNQAAAATTNDIRQLLDTIECLREEVVLCSSALAKTNDQVGLLDTELTKVRGTLLELCNAAKAYLATDPKGHAVEKRLALALFAAKPLFEEGYAPGTPTAAPAQGDVHPAEAPAGLPPAGALPDGQGEPDHAQ